MEVINTMINLTDSQANFKKICDEFKDNHGYEVKYSKSSYNDIDAHFYADKSDIDGLIDFHYTPKGFEFKHGYIAQDDEYSVWIEEKDDFVLHDVSLEDFTDFLENIQVSDGLRFDIKFEKDGL